VTQPRTPDPETVVIGYLTEALANDGKGAPVRVSNDLPPFVGNETDPDTYVWVNLNPSSVAAQTWGGVVAMYWATVDVDCFGPGPTRTAAKDVALRVNDALPGILQFVSGWGQVTRVTAALFAPRPDWNTKIRRVGGTANVWIRPAQAA
jgi:hypothetical protein